jgi:hypothetical protein
MTGISVSWGVISVTHDISYEEYYVMVFDKMQSSRLTNKDSIHEEIKGRLKSGNACYHSVQNILSSSLLSKNVKIKFYRTIILPVVLYGCESWSLTLRKEYKPKVFDNMVRRGAFESKRNEVKGE